MKKIIIFSLIGLALIATNSIAGGDIVYKKARYNSKTITTNQCRELYASGILEIKNKNLDYDKNNILFKTQRISYVIPDKYSILNKKCKHILMGVNDIPMDKMIRQLD